MRKGKLFLIASIIAVVLLITGCGANQKKTLTCTQSASGVDIEFKVGFIGNLIKTIEINYDMDLSKYTDEQIEMISKQDFCEVVKNAMSDYKTAFTSCEKDIKDKHLTINSSLDINKIAKNIKQKFENPEKAKKELEEEKYTCELK